MAFQWGMVNAELQVDMEDDNIGDIRSDISNLRQSRKVSWSDGYLDANANELRDDEFIDVIVDDGSNANNALDLDEVNSVAEEMSEEVVCELPPVDAVSPYARGRTRKVLLPGGGALFVQLPQLNGRKHF